MIQARKIHIVDGCRARASLQCGGGGDRVMNGWMGWPVYNLTKGAVERTNCLVRYTARGEEDIEATQSRPQ